MFWLGLSNRCPCNWLHVAKPGNSVSLSDLAAGLARPFTPFTIRSELYIKRKSKHITVALLCSAVVRSRRILLMDCRQCPQGDAVPTVALPASDTYIFIMNSYTGYTLKNDKKMYKLHNHITSI